MQKYIFLRGISKVVKKKRPYKAKTAINNRNLPDATISAVMIDFPSPGIQMMTTLPT